MSNYSYEVMVEPYLDKITGWVSQGYASVKLARLLGVPVTTFDAMVNIHPALYDAIAEGRRLLLSNLEYTMYERARGVHVTEEKVVEETKFGAKSSTVTKTTKFIYSDKLMITALKKLDPRTYGSLTLDNMTPEEKVDALVTAVRSLPDDLLVKFYEGIKESLSGDSEDVDQEE